MEAPLQALSHPHAPLPSGVPPLADGYWIEIAAYSYDDSTRPYSPPNSNLLQPFAARLEVGVPYRLRMEVEPASTTYTLDQPSASAIKQNPISKANTPVFTSDTSTPAQDLVRLRPHDCPPLGERPRTKIPSLVQTRPSHVAPVPGAW